MRKYIIATRSSKLALWQANHVKALMESCGAKDVTLLPLKTTGDKILDTPLAKIGGKGLFVKEIEEALLDGRADLAVHSMKDVPSLQPSGLEVGVVPRREDLSDSLLSVHYASLDQLPQGAKVGTCSLRRQAQLLGLRPDLTIENLRGNVDTRLRKLLEGQYDAIVMATSGLNRLELRAPKQSVLGPPQFLPAVGQGALGIEYRTDDAELMALLEPLNHAHTKTCVAAERGFLEGLEGGCQVPIAAHALLRGDTLRLEGLVAEVDGSRIIRRGMEGKAGEARMLGLALAREVLEAGGRDILERLYDRS